MIHAEYALAQHLPAYAGPALIREIRALKTALDTPKRPVAAVVGGAKISTKPDVLTHLISRVDHFILGGGMANTFLGATGASLGSSLQEEDLHETARNILKQAQSIGCKVILPVDGRVSRAFAAGAEYDIVALNADTSLEDGQMILDAGAAPAALIVEELKAFKSLIWNGPLGEFAIEPIAKTTIRAATAS